MAEERVPRFEMHIRPMIRLLDREHMSGFGFDLWDYQVVKDRGPEILKHLKGELSEMPPLSHGGPWVGEWVALFERWVNADFPRLELGKVDANGYRATVSGTSITIMATGRFPTSGYRAWLDPQILSSGMREYTLYWEPPVPAQLNPGVPFRVRERFEADPPPQKVVVVDMDGPHELTLTIPPSPLLVVPGSAERVEARLVDMGARLESESPAEGYTLRTFRLKDKTVEVYSDRNFTHAEGPEELLDALRGVL